nr:cytochrome c biogenesis B [Xyris indica]
MRLIFLFHKQIFPSPPITTFFLFLSYIVVTPTMIGFAKDFACYSRLGSIRIPLLFPFPPEPFPHNSRKSGTLELLSFCAYCFPQIQLNQLVGHRVLQISRVFCAFPILLLPYPFDPSGMDLIDILLGSPVLTLLCGIHSPSALGIGWNSSLNPTTSPTSLPPTLSRTSNEREGFHVLSSIGYSSPFVPPYPISVWIISQD